jgi:membrane protease YdiL (CAAX protease family)
MKLGLWIVPAIVFIQFSGQRFREVVALHRIRKAVVWGSAIGSLLAITSLIPKALNHQPLFPASLSWALINVAVVAPIVEEITFRGAILGALLQNYRFGLANTITAFLFVVAHMPGWYFQGRLVEMFTHPLGGALSVFFVGWLLGVAAFRSQSLVGSIIAHSINNFFS